MNRGNEVPGQSSEHMLTPYSDIAEVLQPPAYYTQKYKDRKMFEANWNLGANSILQHNRSRIGSADQTSPQISRNLTSRVKDFGISFDVTNSGFGEEDYSHAEPVVNYIDSGFLENNYHSENSRNHSFGYKTRQGIF